MKHAIANAVLKDQGSRAFFVKYKIRSDDRVDLWRSEDARGKPSPESVLVAFHTYMQRARRLPPDAYAVTGLHAEFPDLKDEIVIQSYDVPGGPNPDVSTPAKRRTEDDAQERFPGI